MDDERDDIWDIVGAEPSKGELSDSRTQVIGKKIKRKQSQADFVEFGFAKIWIILIEFLSVFYVRAQENNINIKNKDLINKTRGDKDEL